MSFDTTSHTPWHPRQQRKSILSGNEATMAEAVSTLLSCWTISGHALSFYCIGKSSLCVCFNKMGSSKFMDGVSAHCSFAYKTLNLEFSNAMHTPHSISSRRLTVGHSLWRSVSLPEQYVFGFRVHWSLYRTQNARHSSTNMNACEIAISGCSITTSMKSGHHGIGYVLKLFILIGHSIMSFSYVQFTWIA